MAALHGAQRGSVAEREGEAEPVEDDPEGPEHLDLDDAAQEHERREQDHGRAGHHPEDLEPHGEGGDLDAPAQSEGSHGVRAGALPLALAGDPGEAGRDSHAEQDGRHHGHEPDQEALGRRAGEKLSNVAETRRSTERVH